MKTFGALVLVLGIAAVCVSGLSECERKRENTLRNQKHPKANQTNIENVALVVECNSDGTYKPLQCFPPSTRGRFCMCYDPEGQVIKSPSKKIQACDCFLDKYNSERSGKPARACKIDGSYE